MSSGSEDYAEAELCTSDTSMDTDERHKTVICTVSQRQTLTDNRCYSNWKTANVFVTPKLQNIL